ncbi:MULTISPECIES: hypothetical protein [Microbacterium]|uniref:Uncharacterized protein n=1 Tax=Microbacterium mcarthurae TaxID=3035918 RepID=A0ABW9GFZ4_9MICO|nr:hypothetical protein [Microbacterium sp. ACRRU]MCG7418590.1 hypothetical protein [Microbacterium sp. ACRRU]
MSGADEGGQDPRPRKYPPGTVAIWVAVSAVGLWLLGSGLIGILSGN